MVHVAILAGARKRNYIKRWPKCFLDMPTGECIVEEILHQIKGIKKVESVIVVGPPEGLAKLRERDIFRFGKKILLVPQGKNIQENCVLAKQELLKSLKKKEDKNLGLLFLWGDTPYRKRCSVEEFIGQLDVKKDVIISFVHESKLGTYYGLFKKPLIPLSVGGIPGNYKETNMVYLNPDIIIGDLGKRFYKLRHTSRFKTMIALRKLINQLGGKDVLSVLMRGFFVRRWHALFRGWTPTFLHTPRSLYKRLDKDRLALLAEKKLGIKMDIVFSSYPDGFIDIDTKEDYRKIYRHFFELNREIVKDCFGVMRAKDKNKG